MSLDSKDLQHCKVIVSGMLLEMRKLIMTTLAAALSLAHLCKSCYQSPAGNFEQKFISKAGKYETS